MSFTWYVVGTLFLLILIKDGDGSCTFPSDLQSGTWQSSDMGDVTFNSSHFVVSSIVDFGSRTFECMELSGSQYYVLSDSFSYLSTPFKIAMCFTLYQNNTYMFSYYPLSPVLANTDVNRIIFQTSSYGFTSAETCSLTNETFTNYRALIRSGYTNETTIDCNNELAARASYNVTSSSCASTYMDACTNQTLMEFNYTLCSTTMMFSSGGNVRCVWYAYDSNTSYTLVYNEDATTDESTNYRYSCVASTLSGNTTYSTVYPRACLETQTSNTTTSPGYTVVFEASYTYPSTEVAASSSSSSAETFSAGAAAAVVVALLLLIAAGVIVGIWYYIKVYRVKKVVPDTDVKDVIPAKSPPVNTQEEAPKEETNNGGRVSPFSPYPTVSELATYRFGPSPAPVDIDDDDGGMTLEATTPGFTEGRRTRYDPMTPNDQGSRTSLPVYSEVGGETPEPTRLSEVQTRMSEITVTETNIEDPAPFTMTRATMNIPEENTVSPIESPVPQPNDTAVTPRDMGATADDGTL